MESSDNLYGMNVREAKCYNMGLSACKSELCAALYPNGIKHPQQAEWEWMIQEVSTLRARIAELEAPPSENDIFDAIFNHTISRNHNMTGRECRQLAKAAIEKFMEGRLIVTKPDFNRNEGNFDN